MKAIVVREFGGPEVLRFEDAPKPSPGAGQVLVRIEAAGVNQYDGYVRSGTYAIKPSLPYTPGSDGAGVVESVGDSVKKFKAGDRVYVVKTVTGAYAEYAVALESKVHPIPDKITDAQGACIGATYGSAYRALHKFAKARAGEILLVHGASGGVGTAAVQIARAMGLAVFGTAGSAKGIELIQREGAHEVFDHTKPKYQDEILKATDGRGVDIVLEMHANINLGNDLKLLAHGGRVVVMGTHGDATISPRDLLTKWASILALTLWGITEAEEKEIYAGLNAGLDNCSLRPVVGKELPLAQAVCAHKEILESGAFGKIVLIP